MNERDYELQLEAFRIELDELRAENERLRRALGRRDRQLQSVPCQPGELRARAAVPKSPTNASSPIRSQIALFRNLFRGREDVYPVRWRAKDGRAGYAPKAQRDWEAYMAARPEDRKAVDRRTRKLLPLTDEAVAGHLNGAETIGVYPLLTDDTCWLLAIDFDGPSWSEDAGVFTSVCAEEGVPSATERSRSGNGGHVWIFFDHPVSASAARALGSALLTKSADRRHQIDLKSYDRLFPNQDTLPKAGFGNLIALPLQRDPSRLGNSLFVDANLEPYPDQWAFLASMDRIPSGTAVSMAETANRKGTVLGVRSSGMTEELDPWILPPSGRPTKLRIEETLPSKIEVVLANRLFVAKEGLPTVLVNRILRLAAFQNPEFYKAQALRLSTRRIPRIIQCAEELLRHVALPRGSLSELTLLLKENRTEVDLIDKRCKGEPISVSFFGELRPNQRQAAEAMLAHDCGVLSAPPAFGKTAVAAYAIAERRVSTLILVHRRKLLEQWRDRLAMFLDVPLRSIGHVGGGRAVRTGIVDVALIQSLHAKKRVADMVAEYGQIIVDECHHVAAFTYEKVMREAKALFVMGLTATPTRKDGLHPIIAMQCGPVRYRLSPRSMTEAAPFEHKVLARTTNFRLPESAGDQKIHQIYAAMIADPARNGMIVDDLVSAVKSGRSPLLLSARVKHLDLIASLLNGKLPNVFILKGGMGRRQLRVVRQSLSAIPEHEPRLILATGSYIGEGYDDPRLDTLFLAMPVSWKGTLQQYVGRLHRLRDGKQVVQVYDYVDSEVPMLKRMFQRRVRGYRVLGYSFATATA